MPSCGVKSILTAGEELEIEVRATRLFTALIVEVGGSMITRINSECPVAEPVPDPLLVFGIVPERGCTDAFSSFKTRLAGRVTTKKQVVRACFGVDRKKPRLRLSDCLH